MRMDVAERRARLARRHHLAPTALAADVVEAAGDIVGLHGTDPTSVYVEAWARSRDLEIATLERALYEERSVLKILGMRRTMFVVPVDLAGVIDSACARAIGVTERRRLIGMIEAAGISDDAERWVEKVEAETVAALEARGEATAAELTKDVPGLREQIAFGAGKKWQGKVGVSTRLLFLLSCEGRIIRGRPRGTLVSSLYRWVPMDRWVEGGLEPWPTVRARSELVRRWLAAFGPGTIEDLRWWTGWTLRGLRAALAGVDTVEVELEDGVCGLVLANDVDATRDPGPWVGLLPALDATVMGWKDRAWFLGEHAKAMFDRNGNAGPSVWVDGRVVGGWAHRPDGEVVVRLLDDIGSEASNRIAETAARLSAWLGPVRITPRFRTPLEQELVR
jgi:hypothetical protein